MYTRSPESAVRLKPIILSQTRWLSKNWWPTSHENLSSVLQGHSSSSNGNKSNASKATEQLRQQKEHVIPDVALVKDNDRNWSPEEIASENEYKILQHGNDSIDVSAFCICLHDYNEKLDPKTVLFSVMIATKFMLVLTRLCRLDCQRNIIS